MGYVMVSDDPGARLEAVRRRVVAVLGHALRTPVTTIRGLAELVDGTDGPPPSGVVDALARETRILERLVDDLLVLSDVTTVLPVGRPQALGVGEVADRVWRRVCEESRDEAARARLVVEADADVMVGQDALEWILRHVLDNARAYADGPVVVAATTEGATTRVEIRSLDARVTDDDAKNAFELFYRGEEAVMATAGLGVGLPVSRLIAEHAGGRLDARLEGAEFVVVVELPAP